MNGTDVMNGVDAAFGALIAHREEIEELDQAIGDGDHIFNLIRGLEAVRTAREFIAAQPLADALKSVARKLLETVGGSLGVARGRCFRPCSWVWQRPCPLTPLLLQISRGCLLKGWRRWGLGANRAWARRP